MIEILARSQSSRGDTARDGGCEQGCKPTRDRRSALPMPRAPCKHSHLKRIVLVTDALTMTDGSIGRWPIARDLPSPLDRNAPLFEEKHNTWVPFLASPPDVLSGLGVLCE